MARFYTTALRIPQLIGRTPDGTKLPFGPYTIPQLLAGVVTAVVLWNTTRLWAQFGLVMNVVLAAGLVFTAVWATGRLPLGLRNPMVLLGGWLHALGRMGPPLVPLVRLPKPGLVRSQVSMFTDPVLVEADDPDPDPDMALAAADDPAIAAPTRTPAVAAAPAAQAPRPVGLPALTGVQRLLAQTTPSK